MIPSWLQHNYQQLQQLGATGQLHHGLLLLGKEGVGSFDLAYQLALDLLCMSNGTQACGVCKACTLNKSQTNPDFMLVSAEKDSISVEQVRAISDFFVSTASFQGNKVVIVKDAHALTLSASNALLKTLEEPNANRYLVLLSDPNTPLPATILSRCFKITLTVDANQAKQFIGDLGIDATQPWVNAFLHRPLCLKQWQEDGQLSAVESLYQLSQQQTLQSCHKQLLELFNQNTDYIDIFAQFCAQKLQTELLSNTLDVKRYQEKNQALLSFAHKFKEVKGLNLSLQLNQLLKQLSYL
ncbi:MULTISPECIES: DNA polymerase III subunit delta' [Pseudoalteromonas]|uniref:DNA polymerase III subunit delta' n=1 Tax=Pseudoalteromonas TaxID=53246 RepID=UPI00026CC7E6|nr:DNA polymerase III subunit delta' [Pseudoalteromonas spongiae]ATC98836.1 DNA polymerase III subunit delta' [Pseudoalteromonas spongiae UST010723-006]